ncbi:MAG TPA: hypothetical protein VG738_11970 [Chitinophagaceae bacterium]|nr:hypothetical protein [Chitinophagaceae bacterium]
MKNISLVCLFIFITGAFACDDGFTSSFSNHNGRTTITVNDETGRLRLETRGEITFTDDEKEIKTISDDGYVKFKKNGNSISARPGTGDEIVYVVNDGSPRTVLSENEKLILARAIKEMINVGFDAKRREERLYSNGGANAVLDAVHNLRSDYVKRLYLEYLISGSSVTQNEITDVVRRIGNELNSDYDKSTLLQKIPVSYLQDEQTASAYLDAVSTINSDYEKDNCLKLIVDQPLTPDQYNYALTAIGNINSDYDKANVLKQLISHGVPSENNTNNFLIVTNNIGSDYEKANVLKALLVQGSPVGTSFTKFLDVTDGINSDYEKTEVYKKMATARITSEDDWVVLLKATEKINDDYEKSDAMITIAKYMPKSDRLKSAYMLSAKSITADYNYGQAIKALN